MVEEAVKSYRVAYERDESGWWVATVRGVRGCHTQGRTVDEARRRIREALELFVDDARKAPIVDDVKRAWRAALTAPNARCTRAIRTAPGQSAFSRRPRPTAAARHQSARIPTSPTPRLLPPSLRRFSASGLSFPPTSLLSF